MKLLLDTSTFLWIAFAEPKISDRARSLFQDPSNEVFLSALSAWEIALKYSLGKLVLHVPPHQFVPEQRTRHRITSLPLDENAVYQLTRLPQVHRDPFDRMLICQAIAHGHTILTSDHLIQQYPVSTAW